MTTQLSIAPKMAFAPICVDEQPSSVTLTLAYKLINTDWKCSQNFLEKVNFKLSIVKLYI